MAPKFKHSELFTARETDSETDRFNSDNRTNTTRLQANWADLPAAPKANDPGQLHGVHGLPLQIVPRHSEHSKHSEKRKSGDLCDLFQQRKMSKLLKSERTPTPGTLDGFQHRLKKQVGTIEGYIKGKLAIVITGAGNHTPETIFEKYFEQKSASSNPVRLPVDRVRSEQFAQQAQKLFDKLDANNTGWLTRGDLAKALQNPAIKGQEAQLLAAMYGQFDKLATGNDALDNSEILEGLSKKDLQDYGKTERLYAQETDLANRLARKAANPENSLVRGLGLQNGQFITQNRLLDIDNNEAMRAEDRELVEYMISHFDLIANAHGDRYTWAKHGISLDDMTDYSAKVWNAERFQVVNGVNYIIERTNKSQNRSSDELFADKQNPLASITPDAIKQGTIGDCYFEAAVASVAHRNPQSIRDMIHDNCDGTYTVTFPGAPAEPATVTSPTEAERGLYNNGSPAGTWASVLEKANGLYAQQHFWRRNVLGNFSGGESPSEGGDGGGLGNGLSLLTGSEVSMHLLAIEKRESLRSCLNETINAKTPKSVITFTGPDLPLMRTTPGNFARSHVYTILAFDPEGDNGGTLTIRNPWGQDESGPRGTVKVSFDEYRANFCGFFAEI